MNPLKSFWTLYFEEEAWNSARGEFPKQEEQNWTWPYLANYKNLKFICGRHFLVFRGYLLWRLLGTAHTRVMELSCEDCLPPSRPEGELEKAQLWPRFVQYNRAISPWAWKASPSTALKGGPSLAWTCWKASQLWCTLQHVLWKGRMLPTGLKYG